MNGELDDPLLLNSVPYGDRISKMGVTANEDSSMGMNMRDRDDESMMSIGKIGQNGGLGVDDSELSNGIVGITPKKVPKAKSEKPDKKNKAKDKKKKTKKSKKSDSDDDGDDTLKVAL